MSPIEEHVQNLTGGTPTVDIGANVSEARANYNLLLKYVKEHGEVHSAEVAYARRDIGKMLEHYGDAGISALLLESLKLSFPKD